MRTSWPPFLLESKGSIYGSSEAGCLVKIPGMVRDILMPFMPDISVFQDRVEGTRTTHLQVVHAVFAVQRRSLWVLALQVCGDLRS